MSDEPVVWLPTFHRYAILIQQHAYYSVASWTEDGQRFEVEVANDEYEKLGDDD